MLDILAMTNQMIDRALGRSPIITLGQLIDLLEQRPQDDDVVFDFGYFVPKTIRSYRGYYAHLALGYEETDLGDDVTVAELLGMLRDVDGRTFEGYKGGDFKMSRDTWIWAANYSEAPGTAIVGLADCAWQTVIQTAYVEV